MKGIDGFIQATEEKHDPEVVAYGMLMLLDGVVTFWLYEHVHSGGHFVAAASTSMYHRRYHE